LVIAIGRLNLANTVIRLADSSVVAMVMTNTKLNRCARLTLQLGVNQPIRSNECLKLANQKQGVIQTSQSEAMSDSN